VDGLVRSGGARTLYIDDAVWERIQELVRLGYAKNASQLVNRLLEEALNKLSDSERPLGLSYEALKSRHLALTRSVSNLVNRLERAYGRQFRELFSLARRLGLDIKTLSNFELVAPKLISVWKENPTPLHLFITLLEQTKEKREIERKLKEIRERIYSAQFSLRDA